MLRITLLLIVNLALWLLLSGHLPGGSAIPPLGQLLHPYQGLWANGVVTENSGTTTLSMPGLDDEVTIKYDQRGVPHIYASTTKDAIQAMGYVEARDRAFQMDFTARAASGRLSEIVGSATVDFDKKMLRNGMVYAAEQSLKRAQSLPGFEYMKAYAAGINAYVDQLDYADHPVECKILDYELEPWSPIKSLYITAYMSQDLNHHYDDLENTNLLAALGRERFEELYPQRNPLTQPITYNQDIPAEAILTPQVKNDIVADSLVEAFYQEPEEGIGSNAWAVNAALSASGRPMYASDPHLQLSLPSIWYELQIHTPDYACHGVKIVGVPGMMMGFNEHIAWGETNVGHDQTDLYRIKWVDAARTRYLLDGKEVPATIKVERIKVKGGSAVIDTVRYTHWGPVTFESQDGQNDLAQRWIIHDGADRDEILAFIEMMGAKGFHDYYQATNHYVGPPQNFNMAAKDDTVAIRISGNLPLRSTEDGIFVEEGTASANGWSRLIPREQNPIIVNPPSGYVSSSNQRTTDSKYPYYYYGKFSDYRNRAIDTVLSSDTSFTVQDMKALHFNSYSIEAADILPTLLAALDATSAASGQGALLDELRKWDYRYTSESVAATAFDEWLAATDLLTWDEMTRMKGYMDVRYPEMFKTIDMLKNEPGHPFFDRQATEKVEKAADIIKEAWDETITKLAEKDFEDLRWGHYRSMTIRHLARIPGMGVDSIITDGCTTCINANGRTKGPSWRMVVELGDEPNGYGVFPGGQSGNPLSPWYTTGVDTWAAGEYYNLPLYHDPDQVPATATFTLSTSE